MVNFNHYTDNTGQVRSNQFVDSPWQLREFKITLNAEGQPTFVLDTVKSNPLAELFKADQAADSDVLKTLRADFATDFISDYIDHLLAPELEGLPLAQATTLINSIHLNNDDRYNEFQSDAFGQDNTDQFTGLDALIEAELDARSDTLPGYTVDMIKTRAEAMSCGGCHKNASFKAIAPSIDWPLSNGFTHVNSAGNLSNALTERFLPGRADVLAAYLNDEANIPPQDDCGEACQLGSANSGGGNSYSCALQKDGKVKCFGLWWRDVSGVLAKQIATGFFDLCLINKNTQVECFRKYRSSGGFAEVNLPDLTAKQVVVGGQHACALKLNGTVTCWGESWSRIPTNIPAGLVAKQIASASYHMCAIDVGDTVVCWGMGRDLSPVPSGLKAKQIAAGRFISCAVKLDSTVACWGDAVRAPLDDDWIPREIQVKQISVSSNQNASNGHICVIRLDDSVSCWGQNNAGQINVPEGLHAKQVVVGDYHSCAIKFDGGVSCWGDEVVQPPNIVAKSL